MTGLTCGADRVHFRSCYVSELLTFATGAGARVQAIPRLGCGERGAQHLQVAANGNRGAEEDLRPPIPSPGSVEYERPMEFRAPSDPCRHLHIF